MWNTWKYWRAAEIIKRMPEHYQRYLYELQHKHPKPVHFIPEPGKFKKDPVTGEIKRVENRPIPLIFPYECNKGLWGGEAVIKGYQKRHPLRQRVPHWWVPVLKRAVIYSEILDKHLSVVVTERTLDLIDEAYGLDYYILKTHPVDLRSQLGMDMKRNMLLTLVRREMYPDDPEKQERIYKKYKEFIIPEEEAEWCGLSILDAVKKQQSVEEEQNKPVALKIKYRAELIEMLKERKSKTEDQIPESKNSSNWLNKLNPFGKATTAS